MAVTHAGPVSETVLKISQTLFEYMPAGVLGVDDSGLIVMANREARRIFGEDRALVGESAPSVLPLGLNRLISSVATHREEASGTFEIVSEPWIAKIRRLPSESGALGAVIVLMPE